MTVKGCHQQKASLKTSTTQGMGLYVLAPSQAGPCGCCLAAVGHGKGCSSEVLCMGTHPKTRQRDRGARVWVYTEGIASSTWSAMALGAGLS